MFGEDLNWTPLPVLTTPKIQDWYDNQCKRIAVVSANPYVTIIKSFLSWAVEKNIISKNPANGVKLQKNKKPARVKFCGFEREIK